MYSGSATEDVGREILPLSGLPRLRGRKQNNGASTSLVFCMVNCEVSSLLLDLLLLFVLLNLHSLPSLWASVSFDSVGHVTPSVGVYDALGLCLIDL